MFAQRMLRREHCEKYHSVCCFPLSTSLLFSKYLQELVLKCIGRETVLWKFNFDDADKNIEEGIFRFSPKRGCLHKEESVVITVSFWPRK